MTDVEFTDIKRFVDEATYPLVGIEVARELLAEVERLRAEMDRHSIALHQAAEQAGRDVIEIQRLRADRDHARHWANYGLPFDWQGHPRHMQARTYLEQHHASDGWQPGQPVEGR